MWLPLIICPGQFVPFRCGPWEGSREYKQVYYESIERMWTWCYYLRPARFVIFRPFLRECTGCPVASYMTAIIFNRDLYSQKQGHLRSFKATEPTSELSASSHMVEFLRRSSASCSFVAKMSRFVSISDDDLLAVTFSSSLSSDVEFQFGNIIAGVTHPFCPSSPPSSPLYTASAVVRVFPESSDTSIVLPPHFFPRSVVCSFLTAHQHKKAI